MVFRVDFDEAHGHLDEYEQKGQDEPFPVALAMNDE